MNQSEYWFNSFVPGFIGDPKAEADTAFRGAGWKYVQDQNYIVFVSTDYDNKGVDQSGYNFSDWPIRLVVGKERYVQPTLDRLHYAPVFKSEQDFFTIFKDTETLVDAEYRSPSADPDSFSIPIGIEVREYCYSWSEKYGTLKNAVVFVFEVVNKSGEKLEPAYGGIRVNPRLLTDKYYDGNEDTTLQYFYSPEPWRNLGIVYNPTPFIRDLFPPSALPVFGIKVLDGPVLSSSESGGMTVFTPESYSAPYSDKARFDSLIQLPLIHPPWIRSNYTSAYVSNICGTGPFTMQPGESIRITMALFFGVGIDRVLQLDDYLTRVFQHNFSLPTPPQAPNFTLQSAGTGVRVAWDSQGEKSTDPLVPDSLGRPFLGYRLYRARVAKGPYLLIKEWRVGRDSIVHEYVDRGQDGLDSSLAGHGGLANNIPFSYKFTAYDEGAPALELPPMESVSEVKTVSLSGDPSSPYALENIRIVPNPYIVTHAAQQSIDHPKLFFNYLPEECTIRIYTVALELVAELHHHGGSAEEWDLRTQGGQQVASQLLIAQIQTPQGTAVVKKFAVVLAE